jgi:hypothetical protein
VVSGDDAAGGFSFTLDSGIKKHAIMNVALSYELPCTKKQGKNSKQRRYCK